MYDLVDRDASFPIEVSTGLARFAVWNRGVTIALVIPMAPMARRRLIGPAPGLRRTMAPSLMVASTPRFV
jgi:hypothetical protein